MSDGQPDYKGASLTLKNTHGWRYCQVDKVDNKRNLLVPVPADVSVSFNKLRKKTTIW